MPPSQADESILLVQSLSEIAARFDVLLCDVWGVMHNGLVAYPAASDALSRFRTGGGVVILVSNAPRPGTAVVRQLDRLGVPRTAYDAVLTSGDLTRAEIGRRDGQAVHHMGPERDKPIFAGLEARLGSLDEAAYVVCSGFFDDEHETVDDYKERLDWMRERGLPMICANPDLVVERGHRLIPCAGAIALAYEEIGGDVFYAGKPHRPVYEEALTMAEKLLGGVPVARSRVLAVGDAIRTDIAGAQRFGLFSLLVARGIHAQELIKEGQPLASSHVQDWVTRQEARPNAIADTLAW
jgi:HAD superfamily hydrolase (TIGR01459 family)